MSLASRSPLVRPWAARLAAAVALAGDDTGPAAFSTAALADPVLRTLRQRVTVREHHEPWTEVTVRLTSGAVLTTTEPPDQPADDADLPGQRVRLEAKFASLVSPVLGADRTNRLLE